MNYVPLDPAPSPLTKPRDFVFAGRAHFSLRNARTGARYTYKVTRPKKQFVEGTTVFFVSYRTAEGWTYLGMIAFDKFKLTKASKMPFNDPSVKGIIWLLRNLDDIEPPMEFYHEGRCAKCGRRLTDPESIKTGFGPHCYQTRKETDHAES